jgi:hypothetical protein
VLNRGELHVPATETLESELSPNFRAGKAGLRRRNMKGFLFGLGIGIALGVLFAPMSGEETRESLSERASEFAQAARENVEQGKERAQRAFSSFRSGEARPTGTETGG